MVEQAMNGLYKDEISPFFEFYKYSKERADQGSNINLKEPPEEVDLSSLSLFQRILLTTNGTISNIVEAYMHEKIRSHKLAEQFAKSDELKDTLYRTVTLQGEATQNNFVYAESIIKCNRLANDFKKALLETDIPIGKLWNQYKIEYFKEILQIGKETAGEVSRYFHIMSSDKLLKRTFLVRINSQPSILITEKFPESYFLKMPI